MIYASLFDIMGLVKDFAPYVRIIHVTQNYTTAASMMVKETWTEQGEKPQPSAGYWQTFPHTDKHMDVLHLCEIDLREALTSFCWGSLLNPKKRWESRWFTRTVVDNSKTKCVFNGRLICVFICLVFMSYWRIFHLKDSITVEGNRKVASRPFHIQAGLKRDW